MQFWVGWFVGDGLVWRVWADCGWGLGSERQLTSGLAVAQPLSYTLADGDWIICDAGAVRAGLRAVQITVDDAIGTVADRRLQGCVLDCTSACGGSIAVEAGSASGQGLSAPRGVCPHCKGLAAGGACAEEAALCVGVAAGNQVRANVSLLCKQPGVLAIAPWV